MQKNIKFAEKVHFKAGNKEGIMTGVEVFTGEFVTYIAAIDNKDKVVSPDLQIPYDSIPELIATLQEAYDKRLTPFKK